MKDYDLIELGFTRTDVSEKESGDNAFYYFYLDIGENKGISLISPSNDEIVDDNWYVEIWEDSSIRFTSNIDLKQFIKLVKRNTIINPDTK